MFWVVLAWAGASLCRSTVLWLRYKQGFSTKSLAQSPASHVLENRDSLCLFRGCCVESGNGLCRGEVGEWWGGGGLLWFWKSVRVVTEPPPHRKSTSSPHPKHTKNMWQHIFTEALIRTYKLKCTVASSPLFLLLKLSTQWICTWHSRQETGNTRRPCLQGEHVMQQLRTPEKLESQESRIN